MTTADCPSPATQAIRAARAMRLSALTLSLTLSLSLGLTGCGGTLVAPEGPASNAFLDQVSSACGKLKIGAQPIDYLLDVNSNDTYFVDETSKLAAGRIDKATYTGDINSFYPAGDNGAALACIFAQLD